MHHTNENSHKHHHLSEKPANLQAKSIVRMKKSCSFFKKRVANHLKYALFTKITSLFRYGNSIIFLFNCCSKFPEIYYLT